MTIQRATTTSRWVWISTNNRRGGGVAGRIGTCLVCKWAFGGCRGGVEATAAAVVSVFDKVYVCVCVCVWGGGLMDNSDDPDGYYNFQVGSLLILKALFVCGDHPAGCTCGAGVGVC
jgi:hypothetical protein